MKAMKKILCFVCIMAWMGSMLFPSVSDAKKKAPKLNKNKVTITVGKKKTIKVKNTKKKVKWSIKTGKKKIKLTKKKKTSVVVVAKKKGKATVAAKVGKKTLKCNVTVKAKKKDTKDDTSTDKQVVTAVKISSVKVVNPETIQVALTSAQKLSIANFTVKSKEYGHGAFNKKLTIASVNATDWKNYIIKLDNESAKVENNDYVQVTITGLQVTGTASVESVYTKAPQEYTKESMFSIRATRKMEKTIYSSGYGNSMILSKKLPEGVSCDIIYDVDEECFQLTGAIAKAGIYTGEIVYKDELNNRYTEKITWIVGDDKTLLAGCLNSYGVYREGESNYVFTDLAISGGSGDYSFVFPDDEMYYEWEDEYLETKITSAGKQEFEIQITDNENEELKTTVIWTVELIESQKVTVHVKDAMGNTITNNDNVYAKFKNQDTNSKFCEDSSLIMDDTGNYFVYLVEGATYDYEVELMDTSKKAYDYKVTEKTESLDITLPIYPVILTMENLDISKAKWRDSDGYIVGTGDKLYLSERSYELYAEILGTTIYKLEARFDYDGKAVTITPTITSQRSLSQGTITTDEGKSVVLTSDYMYYTFVPEETGNYFFYSEMEDADPDNLEDSMGVLLNEDFDIIASNDDYDWVTMGYNFGFVKECQAGKTYYVGLAANGNSFVGLDAVLYVEKTEKSEESEE